MKSDVYLVVMTARRIDDQQTARSLFAVVAEVAPQLLPKRVGKWQPLERTFDPDNVDVSLAEWGDSDFLWAGKKTDGQVLFSVPDRSGYSTLTMRWDADAVESSTGALLLTRLSEAVGAEFGCVELLTPAAVERGLKMKTVMSVNRARTEFTFVLTGRRLIDLGERLPDLYWATVIGPRYVQSIGRNELLASPCEVATELDGSIYLQLTRSLTDMHDRVEDVEGVRRAVMNHIGQNFFPSVGQAG